MPSLLYKEQDQHSSLLYGRNVQAEKTGERETKRSNQAASLINAVSSLNHRLVVGYARLSLCWQVFSWEVVKPYPPPSQMGQCPKAILFLGARTCTHNIRIQIKHK